MTKKDIINILDGLGMVEDINSIKVDDIVDIINFADDVTVNNDLNSLSKFIVALLVKADVLEEAHQERKKKSEKAFVQLEKQKLLEHIKQNVPDFQYDIETNDEVCDACQIKGD